MSVIPPSALGRGLFSFLGRLLADGVKHPLRRIPQREVTLKGNVLRGMLPIRGAESVTHGKLLVTNLNPSGSRVLEELNGVQVDKRSIEPDNGLERNEVILKGILVASLDTDATHDP